eukprot:comp22846_c0_seq1/m.35998 comp22846_c0_seq1/g.35998  ORF comp22846_c0_seq1/g.35998 comp22846_c0_seq1/m.35998 type:complete len:354 (-) comp22846_c0_seq1:315-1376(-)
MATGYGRSPQPQQQQGPMGQQLSMGPPRGAQGVNGIGPGGVLSGGMHMGHQPPPHIQAALQGMGAPNRPLSELDMSDFPALSVRAGAQRQPGAPMPTPVGMGLGGIAKAPGRSEFSFLNEDFPALQDGLGHQDSTLGGLSGMGPDAYQYSAPLGAMKQHGLGKDYPLASTDSGSSGDAQRDQYGLYGLVSVIRMTDPDLNTLALGSDLTTLGLNLNSHDMLYRTFQSPWASQALKESEPEFNLPACYTMAALPPPLTKMEQFNDNTLFYIFYAMPRDILQQAAAQELTNRDWRYHKDLKLWYTRMPETATQKAQGFERGSVVFFDVGTWQKVRKDGFVMPYEPMEERKPSAVF